MCIGPVEASYPSPVVRLVVAAVGIAVGIAEVLHLDSFPCSCLRSFQPYHFLPSELLEVWIFVAGEWVAAYVDSPASPVGHASRDLPGALPYCLRRTVGPPFQTLGACESVVDEADVVAERGPLPFRRPVAQYRSFRGITTGTGRRRASLYHHSQVHPYQAEYETPFAGLALAADTFEGRRSAGEILAALTPLLLQLQASPP